MIATLESGFDPVNTGDVGQWRMVFGPKNRKSRSRAFILTGENAAWMRRFCKPPPYDPYSATILGFFPKIEPAIYTN
jgi:hypothetical protein